MSDNHLGSLERFTKPRAAAAGGEKNFGEILKSIETVGAAVTMSYMNGKHARPGRNAFELGGVPVDLALGVVGNVVALSSYLGEYSEHAHNLANGMLCAYGCRIAMMYGAEARVVRMKIDAQDLGRQGYAPQRELPQPSVSSPSFPFTRAPQESSIPPQYASAA